MKELVRNGAKAWNLLSNDKKAKYFSLGELERLRFERERQITSAGTNTGPQVIQIE